MLTYGTLFSGVEGFGVGFDRAGMECAFQVEIDEQCQHVLRRHYPDVPKWRDVTEVNPDDLPAVDVLAFGSPCQDVSVAGRREGLGGQRSGLFHEAIRIADAIAPDWLVLENVPGLLSSQHGEDFAVVLEGFTGFRPAVPEGGWRSSGVCVGPLRWCVWRLLDSRYFGLAQRRRRVFVVAGARAPCRPEILLEPSCLPGDPAPGREAREGAAGELAGGAGDEGRGGAVSIIATDYHGAGFGPPRDVSATLQASGGTDERGIRNPLVIANTVPVKYRGDPHEGTDTLVVGTLDQSRTLDTTGADPSRKQGGTLIVAHTLRAVGHDASEDGTGRGVPLVVDTLVSGEREMPPHGTGDGKNVVLGFRPTDGLDMQVLEDLSPTVKVGSGLGIASPPVVLAFSPLQGGRSMPVTPECPTLESGTGNKAPAVLAFDWQKGNDRDNPRPSTMNAAPESPTLSGTRVPAVTTAIPRRLTPIECSRLQGFSDDWNEWGVDESGERVKLSDSTRYQQFGNAISVPVAEWIGRRIERADVMLAMELPVGERRMAVRRKRVVQTELLG